MNGKILHTATICTAACLMVCSAANGSDMYPGMACQAAFGAESQYLNSYESGINNPSSASRWVSCPAIRSYAYNPSTISAYVYIVQPPGATTTCILHKTDYRGFSINVSDSETAPFCTSGACYGTLSMFISNDASYTDTINLTCLVPPGGWVINYYVDD